MRPPTTFFRIKELDFPFPAAVVRGRFSGGLVRTLLRLVEDAAPNVDDDVDTMVLRMALLGVCCFWDVIVSAASAAASPSAASSTTGNDAAA